MAAAAAAMLAAVGTDAHAKGCHELSYVVGYERCTHFGIWSPDDDLMPRLTFDLGDLTERYVTHAVMPSASGGAFGPPATSVATAFVLRVLYGFGTHLYTGGELEVGGVISARTELGDDDDAYRMLLGVHALIGARTGWHRFSFATELAVGWRDLESTACVGMVCTTLDDSRAELDLRARADYFFNDMGAVGVAIGTNLVDVREQEVMLDVSLHLRAMDGL